MDGKYGNQQSGRIGTDRLVAKASGWIEEHSLVYEQNACVRESLEVRAEEKRESTHLGDIER